MGLHYILPRADLQDLVRAYYYFATRDVSVQPICAEMGNIRIILGGGGVLHTPNRASHTISGAFLIGPTMGSYCMEAHADTRVFGIGIRPKGWIKLCGISAEEATDSIIDLSSFAGGIARSSIEEIRNANSVTDMGKAADRFFTELLRKRDSEPASPFPYALANWLLDPNDRGVDHLLETMDLSRRQTDRLAKMYFGASPKYLQRKYRALRAADRIKAGATDWMSAAGDKFYDQSHFIKDFKAFIGVTPGEFLTDQAQLITEIQAQRRAQSLLFPLASF